MRDAPALSWTSKVVYGTGDFSLSSFTTYRQIFHALFLTSVVGLDPRLAAVAALVGVLWDAVTDPVVGRLSDRTRTSWGRRRPYLVGAAIPFGLSYGILWWVPPWEGQVALMVHFTVAYIVATTFQTLLSVPFYALTPELSSDYDERTSLTSYRMFFNLVASLAVALLAPEIVGSVEAAGGTAAQGYLTVAFLFGTASVVPPLLIAATVREDPSVPPPVDRPFLATLRAAWANVPFRYLALLYMLNWITFDLVALMIPFFVEYHLDAGGGTKLSLFGVGLEIESAMLGVLLVVALVVLPVWTPLSRRVGKTGAYIAAMVSWALVQLGLFFVAPGDVTLALSLALGASLGVSAAHVLPDAMIPDVVDVDEVETGERNEGIYYGAKNLLRKLTGACAIFLALQALGWAGFQPSASQSGTYVPPESAIWAIRLLVGPAGAVLLIGAAYAAWVYPLTRARHDAIRQALKAKRDAQAGRNP
ncbi:MAG: MFS transporter [Myxococcota bacterium]